MGEVLVGALLLILVGTALDRALLRLEDRGWINYRRTGWSRGAAAYHMLELQAMLDPGTRQIVEIRYEQREQEDEAGNPPA